MVVFCAFGLVRETVIVLDAFRAVTASLPCLALRCPVCVCMCVCVLRLCVCVCAAPFLSFWLPCHRCSTTQESSFPWLVSVVHARDKYARDK